MSRRDESRPQVHKGLKHISIVLHVLLLFSGVALLCLALWLHFDPSRHFLLRLVHFSESTPYFQLAIYFMMGTSLLIFIAVGVGISGLWKLERCLLGGFFSLLMLLMHLKLIILAFLVFYHFKFRNDTAMTTYLSDLAKNRYHRDKWVTPLMDSIQFYHKCCGGSGAYDYSQSFWYITNTEMGTTSFVPVSCCRQSQNARAWDLQPIDPMCTQYEYGTRGFNDSVNWTGCGRPTFDHLNWLLFMLALLLIALTVLDVIGLFIVVKCLRKVWSFYSAVRNSIHSK